MPDVMTWLQAGVPLTLVVDLLNETGPDSTRINAAERPHSADAWWTTAVVSHVAAQLCVPDEADEKPATRRAHLLSLPTSRRRLGGR